MSLNHKISCMYAEKRLKEKLAAKSRRAKLWIVYLDYINTQTIHSSRKNIKLVIAFGSYKHVKSRFCCWPYKLRRVQGFMFKCIYSQKVIPGYIVVSLKEFNAVRRSNPHWAGLWSDPTIEQTLMRSIKSRGGLTRGCGMNESVRHLWMLSLNHVASIHQAMTTFRYFCEVK